MEIGGKSSLHQETKQILGRDREIQQLDQIATNIASRNSNEDDGDSSSSSSLLTIRGVAGSGKSSLVESYPWKEKGWLFCSGKFEVHRMAEPYSAVIEALDRLVERWVLEDDDDDTSEEEQHYGEFKKNSKVEDFRQLLARDGQLLKNVLPRAFLLAGIQEAPRSSFGFSEGDLPGSSEDLIAAFQRIISFLCSIQPVAIFLDDIQWADSASLAVIQALVTKQNIPGLLLAVSYRDEEVDESHEVTACLKAIKENGATVHNIHIKDLDLESLNSLIAHLTGREPFETLALTEVIHMKTAGNPFFVLQFLKLLHYEKFLNYSYSSLKWEWDDVGSIHNLANISDNVADVVAATMQRLPKETRLVLQVAACLRRKVVPLNLLSEFFNSLSHEGHASGDFAALRYITGSGVERVLDLAVQKGILIRSDSSKASFMWSHDKLHQFAYDLIPFSKLASWHLRLGKLLRGMNEVRPGEEWVVFAAADQLNRHYDLEGKRGPRIDVAHLNLEAARFSMKKCALFPALDMLRAAAQHLEGCSNRWTEHYDLCLDIYSDLGEIGVQVGQHEDAMQAVREVEENAKCIDDKFRAQCAMLNSITRGNNRDYELGVEKTLEILQMYGEKLPRKVRPGQLFFEKQRLKSNLPRGSLEGLLDLPEMVDRRAIKVTKLLLQHLSFYTTHCPKYKGLLPLTTLRALNLACRKGLCEMAAYAVCNFAIDLKLAEYYQEALNYGQFAIGLVDKFPRRLGSSHCIVKTHLLTAVTDAVLPFASNMDDYLETHRVGLEVGDTEKAVVCITCYAWVYLSVGLPIGPFRGDLAAYGQEAETLKVPYSVQVMFKIFEQTVLNLQAGTCDHPTILNGDAMIQEDELKKVAGNSAKMTLRDINTSRLMLSCIYNDWETAQKMVDDLEEYLKFDILVSRSYLRTTYLGLAAFALARQSGKGKKKYAALGDKALKFFKKEARLGSVNAFPVLTMLEAEQSPSKGKYESAIKTCARLGLVQHEAYMCERAGEYFLALNDTEWARIYMEKALSLYKDWGAGGKVNAMTRSYAEMLTPSSLDFDAFNSSIRGRQRHSKRDSSLMESVMGLMSAIPR